MPKKIKANPKAVEARARKETEKIVKKVIAEKAAEDAKWVDEGSTAAEKRKAEREAKKAEEAAKKQAKKVLQAKEDAEAEKKAKPQKLTRTKILSLAEQRELEAAKTAEVEEMRRSNLVPQIEPQENTNQTAAAQLAKDVATYKGGVVSASSIDEVLSKMTAQSINLSADSLVDGKDKHPEKRMKAAYADYEEKNMPLLKAEHPTLKLSQLKELLWKNWQKSPENPMNQQQKK
jgi:hypothetical protein